VLLCPQADRHSEAARLLMDAAAQLSSRQAPPLQIKKLYVLAALEVEAYRKKALSAAAAGDAGRMGSDGAARSSVLGGAKPAAGAAHTLAGEAPTQPLERLESLLPAAQESHHPPIRTKRGKDVGSWVQQCVRTCADACFVDCTMVSHMHVSWTA
jgi:hypothetical protein